MESNVLFPFYFELRRQALFGLIAGEDLIQSMQGKMDGDRIWYSIQSLVVAAAAVSRMLWPVEAGYQQRGEDLRATLGIADESPLHDRRLRNHLEHINDRLEHWARNEPNHTIIDANIGPASAAEMFGGLAATNVAYLRHFNTSNSTVEFWDEQYELSPIAGELERVYRATDAFVGR